MKQKLVEMTLISAHEHLKYAVEGYLFLIKGHKEVFALYDENDYYWIIKALDRSVMIHLAKENTIY